MGLLLQISILFVLYSIVLVIFGIKNAVITAFLCALLNLIPYVGPLIGGMLMFILSMTANLEADFSTVILPKSIYVMIGFVLGQLVDNFFSQPFYFFDLGQVAPAGDIHCYFSGRFVVWNRRFNCCHTHLHRPKSRL